VTGDQVHELFQAYEAAFNARDPAAVAELFDEVSAIVDGERTVVFPQRDALRDSLRELISYYRSIGFISAQPVRLDIEHVSNEAAEVDVTWRMRLERGDTEFSTRYWLVSREGVPRVAAVLAYSEASSLLSDAAPDD